MNRRRDQVDDRVGDCLPCWLLLAVITPVQAQQKTIILATTTSTQDSGLLDVLLPIFEKKTGYFVKTIAVGSGRPWQWGKRERRMCFWFIPLHAEKKFVAEGYGINRRLIMHNDFIIVGPSEDPAKIKGMKSSQESFKKIASAKALFLSRGDNSGTHAKEKDIWKAAGINPEGEKWYQQTGLGMGQTLNVAAEKKGYTLADRGTYLALKKNLGSRYSGRGRCHSPQYLSCHRGQPGQMAQSQCRRGKSLFRLHGFKRDSGHRQDLRSGQIWFSSFLPGCRQKRRGIGEIIIKTLQIPK